MAEARGEIQRFVTKLGCKMGQNCAAGAALGRAAMK
jgi:hypothetical protein